MTRTCPQCGKDVSENERFCGKCGCPLKEADTAPQPSYGYSNEQPVAYDQQPSYSYSNEQPVAYDQQPFAAPKKKSKKGLIIGIISGAVVLLAAAAFILWMFVFDPDIAIRDSFQKQREAVENGDYRTSYGYSYYEVFGGEGVLEKDLEEFQEFIKQYPEYEEEEKSTEYKILSIAPLSNESISTIKSTLKSNGFTDTDSIETIRLVSYEYWNKKSDASRPYSVESALAIKVNGKWYWLDSDFNNYSAPDSRNEK